MKQSDTTQIQAGMKHEGLNITGYTDKICVQPNETIQFMISTTSPEYTANVVRLLGGMTDPTAVNLPYEAIPADCDGKYPGRQQEIYPGSYAELPLPADWLTGGEFAIPLWIWPTTPALGRTQSIWSCKSGDGLSGAQLIIDEKGCLVFSLSDRNGETVKVRAERPLDPKAWYFITTTYSGLAGQAVLFVDRRDGWTQTGNRQVTTAATSLEFNNVSVLPVILAAELEVGGSERTKHYYNGKIENPKFYRTALNLTEIQSLYSDKELDHKAADLVANYDFGREISTNQLIDLSSSGRHGMVYQAPARAITSHKWTGAAMDYRVAPDHYAAVHFHDDDLEDAAWDKDFTWQLPSNLPNGAYAIRLEAAGQVDFIPFFVRPAVATAPVLFLFPTNTYLAYANEHLFEGDAQIIHMKYEFKLAEQDRYILDHPEVGKSNYDKHNDGSGVYYSSRLRPVLNFRPHYRNWLSGVVRNLGTDLYALGWLENKQQAYDIATDEDLDREGLDLLKQYKVLITGSHPEYWTRPMMEALTEYLDNGGRLMYLGGNGFYWITSLDPSRPHLIEVRRSNSGSRGWDSPPGELFHSTTGEMGGLWRYNGYVPQKLVGVGFTTQGWGDGRGYERLPDSFNPAVEFMFEGIGEDEVIGDFGLILGGAAGDELDRFDHDLGTPSHALRVATATGFTDHYQYAVEDVLMMAPGQGGSENPLVRADMTYFDINGGGAVFSVGSMNWLSSMPCYSYDNNVVRVSDNVLNHFLK